MGILNKLKATVQESKQSLREIIKEYISLDSGNKQLILKKKTVLLFCQQALNRVEQLKNLELDSSEGLIATVEHNKVKVKIHFTSEKITLNKDNIEGELRLLTTPQFQTKNIIYRYLIAGWQNFLGGKVPNAVLPENIRIENNKIYYSMPRNQSQLLEALFSSLKNKSALKTSIKQGELTIETSAALGWDDFNLQSLFKLLNKK
ncbi:hypothetical protein [Pleurocapsa sp. FMAR1]|uniref:hypothetical protein n=1 Tax=Pleurocapsa sp. FMAR1 TaxID=3040204 RepID=UPI0029C6608F|nr:hypothetical protein [Pleurocapsa sp. FMAR1]